MQCLSNTYCTCHNSYIYIESGFIDTRCKSFNLHQISAVKTNQSYGHYKIWILEHGSFFLLPHSSFFSNNETCDSVYSGLRSTLSSTISHLPSLEIHSSLVQDLINLLMWQQIFLWMKNHEIQQFYESNYDCFEIIPF